MAHSSEQIALGELGFDRPIKDVSQESWDRLFEIRPKFSVMKSMQLPDWKDPDVFAYIDMLWQVIGKLRNE